MTPTTRPLVHALLVRQQISQLFDRLCQQLTTPTPETAPPLPALAAYIAQLQVQVDNMADTMLAEIWNWQSLAATAVQTLADAPKPPVYRDPFAAGLLLGHIQARAEQVPALSRQDLFSLEDYWPALRNQRGEAQAPPLVYRTGQDTPANQGYVAHCWAQLRNAPSTCPDSQAWEAGWDVAQLTPPPLRAHGLVKILQRLG